MSHYLSFSQAARALGVSRAQLQQQIRNGDLPCFEGKIEVEELRRRYPTLDIDDCAMVERVQQIKDTAFARRVSRAAFPEPEVMAAQIQRLRADLALERGRAEKYEALVHELSKRISPLLGERLPDRGEVEALWGWLVEEMKRPHKPR